MKAAPLKAHLDVSVQQLGRVHVLERLEHLYLAPHSISIVHMGKPSVKKGHARIF